MTFLDQARVARAEFRPPATASRSAKDTALLPMADALRAEEADILSANANANATDVAAAEAKELPRDPKQSWRFDFNEED